MEWVSPEAWRNSVGWVRYDLAARAEIFMPDGDGRRLTTIDVNSDKSGKREIWTFGGGLEGSDEGIADLVSDLGAFDFEGGGPGNPRNDLRFKLPSWAVDLFEPDWLTAYEPTLDAIGTAYAELGDEAEEHGLPQELARLIQFRGEVRRKKDWQVRYSYLDGALEEMYGWCYDFFVPGFVPPEAADAVEAAVNASRYLELVSDAEIAAGVTYSGTPVSAMYKLVLARD